MKCVSISVFNILCKFKIELFNEYLIDVVLDLIY